MRTITKKHDLKNLLEPSLFLRLTQDEYVIECIDPSYLVTWNRLDIGFRTLYLNLKERHQGIANDIYCNELRAQTFGSLIDPDNSDKKSFEIFKSVFHEIVSDINENNFDHKKTLIPVSSSGSILNGGHRLSAALHLKKNVWVVRTELPPICCDYDYFYRRAVPVEFIEMAVLQLLVKAKNVHIAFLWPSGMEQWGEAEKLFSNVLYRKELPVSFQGAFNLIYQCYQHMDWIGADDNSYHGIQKKRVECFPDSLKVRILIFQEIGGLDQVRKLKASIREMNGIGFSSVHITDTNDEVQNLSQYILNENAWHFLNYTTDFKTAAAARLASLRKDMIKDEVSSCDLVVDGSFVFEAYGLRKAADIDVLVGNLVGGDKLLEWDRHDHELTFHGLDKKELIYNPLYHFTLNGIKVVSLRQMLLFKKSRSTKKDLLDIGLAESTINDDVLRKISIQFQQRFLYAKLRFRQMIFDQTIKVLKIAGFYNYARWLWRRARGLK